MSNQGCLTTFYKQKQQKDVFVEDIFEKIENIRVNGDEQEKQALNDEIETAYLEKEIERMYDRLAKTGKDTSVVSDKLTRLKLRKKKVIK